MSERLAKQRAISERVAEDGFEEFHEHDWKRKRLALASDLCGVFRHRCKVG
jgi:hypothetical protein